MAKAATKTESSRKPGNKVQNSSGYRHPEASALLRPDVGTQAQFRNRKRPATYRYDSSLSPELNWDGQQTGRETAEKKVAALQGRIAELAKIINGNNGGKLAEKDFGIIQAELATAQDEIAELKKLSGSFLNWTGKAERLSLEVPTLPLFVHERLSTAAILETLKGHERQDGKLKVPDLFGDSQLPIHDRLLKAYEHRNGWVNRLILGDSLVVMNSLLNYESMGGQVQTIYMDPPYAVKFGSNFQPFVRKRSVVHGSDSDMVREPEMVQAYRDTWELGIHSFLTYLRDRLLVARDLLHPSGSIFVQMSDTNLHHVREVMDEVFGAENFVSQISFQTTSGFQTKTLSRLGDFLLWYARDMDRIKVRKLYEEQPTVPGSGNATWVLLPDGNYQGVTAAERRGETSLPEGARLYKPDNLQSQKVASKKEPQPFEFEGKTYKPGAHSCWKARYPEGLKRLADAGRLHIAAKSLQYRRFASDFPFKERGNIWTDTQTGSFTDEKLYVVQTNTKVVERCLLMTSDPGDLVFDPTCGSGTTAYCAERWGRRWITCDTSRVPISLARQRLLTSKFDYYCLADPERGPVGGFAYKRKQNSKGDEIGGIVPHIKLSSIANDEPPKEEVLVDRPEKDAGVTRISGPFCIEATIPTPMEWMGEDEGNSESASTGAARACTDHVERMIEVLRRSPVLHLGGGKKATLANVRKPARTISLSAEAAIEGAEKGLAAVVIGPENGAISEKLVYEAAREAYAKTYSQLYVIGFAIQPDARKFVESCEQSVGVPATYIQASMDLVMVDLLKSTRSSQIFSVCGLPDIRLHKKDQLYSVELLGLDVFDPVPSAQAKLQDGGKVYSLDGKQVPAWFLDTDYNGLCFHVCQAFFPKTSAWEVLKRSLRGNYDDAVWGHLAGTTSVSFRAGEHEQIAVKVVDGRGNELMLVKSLSEAEK